MQVCFSCQNILSDEGAHCGTCGALVRCKKCQALIGPTNQFCVQCGTPRGEGTAQGNSNGGSGSATGFNEIEFEGRNLRFRAKVSDPGMQHLSVPVSLFLHAYTGVPVRRSRGTPDSDGNNGTPPLPFADGDDGTTTQKDIDVTPQPRGELPPKTEDSEEARLKELFKERSGEFCLEEPNLKATGKLDYAQRLTYLYLYFQEKVRNEESVPRETLDKILEANKVNDWRTVAWIKDEPSLVPSGDRIHLNNEGRRAARTRLQEAFDDDRTSNWMPRENNSPNNGKAAGGAEKAAPAAKGQNNKADRSGKVKKEWVPKWKARKLDIDGHTLFSKRSLGDKGLFGLWAIRQALGENDESRVVSSFHLTDFLYHAFEIDVDDSGLRRALKAKDMKEFVLNTSGTKFQLLPPGSKAIEKIVGTGKASPKKH